MVHRNLAYLNNKSAVGEYTAKEKYDWSRRFVTINFLKIVDKHEKYKIAKLEHDNGTAYQIPFDKYMIKDTILGPKLLIQRIWLFHNIGE